jgi:hypothetical protein
MKNIDKEFIPYEQALALKSLGFDEPCFGWYDSECQETLNYDRTHNSCGWLLGNHCTAPTYSQAFRWFREKYKLHQYIKQYCGENFFFHIEDMVHPRRFDEYTVEMLRTFNESSTQEEAELECLKKLIEIVKNK